MQTVETEPIIEVTRRSFCRIGGVISFAALAGGAGALLDGCASPTSPSQTTALVVVSGAASGRTISVNIDAGSMLSAVGGMAAVQTSLGLFLVARTGDSTCSVLSSVCTHQGCSVTGVSGSQYVCPCHGATFTTGGQVTGGPAPSALRIYPSQLAGNVLTFNV
jgi:nitrite reductase/ring-hydroxylating ferredoxin subunit